MKQKMNDTFLTKKKKINICKNNLEKITFRLKVFLNFFFHCVCIFFLCFASQRKNVRIKRIKTNK